MDRSQSAADHPQRSLRALIEDLALRTEDLGKSLEGVQGLAEAIANSALPGTRPAALARLQVLDSLTQRLFVLPEILRCLSASVPEGLAMDDVERLRSFSAIMSAYEGAAAPDRSDGLETSGDCELWKP